MIEALVFDMDGTLVDSEKVHYDAWRAILLKHGVKSFPFDEFVAYVGTSNEKLAEDFIISDGLASTVEELVRQKQDIYLEMIPDIELLPGVQRIVEQFHGKLRLAIASSSHRIELVRIVQTFGMEDSFELIVGGDMVRRKKPDPEIYLKTADLLQLPPGRCLAFEDSESGVRAASRAGMFVVAIPNGLSKHHDFSPADLVVTRIDELDINEISRIASTRMA